MRRILVAAMLILSVVSGTAMIAFGADDKVIVVVDRNYPPYSFWSSDVAGEARQAEQSTGGFEEAAGFVSRRDSISDGVAAELANSSLKYRDRIVFDLASRKLFVKAIVPALDRHNMYAKDEDLSRALALLRKSISHFPED